MEGRVIAKRFRLLRPLGRGGMGSVWVAEQEGLGREVALKLLREERGRPDEAQLLRFKREAASLARLNDPHVVTVYDFGVDNDGTPFLAMELVEGPSLRDRLKQDALSEADARGCLLAIARGLAVVHSLGLVHRDLKPANIVLAGGQIDRAKILDFGLAKRTLLGTSQDTADGASLTGDGMVVGTPGYIAPEFALKGVSDDPRSDLYALGVIAWELVTGTAPFAGETPLAVMMAHATAPRPSLDGRVTVSPRYAEITASLLAIDPRDRPSSANDVVALLEDEGAPITGAPRSSEQFLLPTETELGGLRQAAAPTPATPSLSAPPPTPAAPPARPSRWPALGAGAALLLAVAAAVALGPWADHRAGDDNPSSTTSEQPRRGGHLRIGTTSEPGRWALEGSFQSTRRAALAGLLFDRMVEIGSGGTFHSRVLENFALDRSGKTFSGRLRDGVAFNPHPRCFPDGRPATVDDVRASFALSRRHFAGYRMEVERFESLADRRFVVHFKRPAPWALTALRPTVLMPAELEGPDRCDAFDDLAHPAGSGPFRLGTGELPRRIELTRAPRPQNGPPWLDRVTLLHIKDPQSCAELLSTGELDTCLLRPRDADRFVETSDQGLRFRTAWSTKLQDITARPLVTPQDYRLMYLRTGGGGSALASTSVRRAFSALIDRRAFCEAHGSRARHPMTSTLPPFLSPPHAARATAPEVGDPTRELQRVLAGRPLRLGFITAEEPTAALCEALTQHGIACATTLIASGHLEVSADLVDAAIVTVHDTLQSPFLRLTTLIDLGASGGVDTSSLAPLVDAVDASASRRDRELAVAHLAEASDAAMPLIPLCFARPGNEAGVILSRKTVSGIMELPSASVRIHEPFNGLLELAKRAWITSDDEAP